MNWHKFWLTAILLTVFACSLFEIERLRSDVNSLRERVADLEEGK